MQDKSVRSIDPSAMRAINTSATLRSLHRSSPATLTQLKHSAGLSRRALDLILEPLIERGWVIASAADEISGRSAGRPARTYRFNYVAAHLVAIQLDVHSVTALVTDLNGTTLAQAHVPTGDEPHALTRAERLAKVYECVDAALEAAGSTLESIMAATMSTPGIVRDDNTVDRAMSFEEWSGFSLAAELETHFPCPVFVENDAKLAAVGEKWIGTGKHSDNLLWVRADGVRFGIGIIVKGALYRGNNGAAGEVAWATRLGLQSVNSHLMSGLADPAHPLHTQAVEAVDRARAGDPAALQSIRDLADGLAPGLSTLAWVLAPEMLVIGGSLGHIADLLIPALRATPEFEGLPVGITIVGSSLGDHAILSGAVKKSLDALDELLFTNSPLPMPRVMGTTGLTLGRAESGDDGV